MESKFFAINEQEISEELILDLVNNKINFRVFNITDITATVDFLEKTIESQKFSVRVYTENRSAVLAGGLIPTGFTQLAALGAGIGFALHNLATYNPDFEIGKSIGHDRITVTYKKSS
ncbi:hypothetical protein HK18_10945 [Commensalibacter intestini]|uniref:Uncharacterized protein n=1 Tax=Commensalibacter intestini TaxID=479936 RepID=A0A251ZTS0_9PROT|nr:hypothetical protein HK18_10945 [Commensalibacter intestini]